MAKANAKQSKTAAEQLQAALASPAANTWKEAFDSVLSEVAKSGREIVTKSTATIINSLQQSAHNWYVCGEELLRIANTVNERQFARLVNEVFSRFGLSKPTCYRWMGNAEVLGKAVGYAPARDALLTVFGGQGMIVRKDGEASLTGAILAGFKKHPVPTTGSYPECLDWAREVQVIAEKEAPSKQTIEEFYKSLNARFDKLIAKRLDLGVEHLVHCYRALEAKSQPMAMAAFEAFEDSSIAPNVAAKNGLEALKAAQKAGKQHPVASN